MKAQDDDTGLFMTIMAIGLFVGLLLGWAVLGAGCAHRSRSTTQETAKTTWQARETTTATSTATSAKTAASRKFTIRRQIVKKADGSSTETTTTTTEDSGERVETAENLKLQAFEERHAGTETRAKQTKESDTRTRGWWWILLARLAAAALAAALAWWGPSLWARVLGVFRRG